MDNCTNMRERQVFSLNCKVSIPILRESYYNIANRYEGVQHENTIDVRYTWRTRGCTKNFAGACSRGFENPFGRCRLSVTGNL